MGVGPHAAVSVADLPVRATLAGRLSTASHRDPAGVGWTFADGDVSFREMADHAATLSSVLQARRVGRGDHVAVWLPNTVECAASFFACSALGAIFVPLNTRSKIEELRFTLSRCAPRVLVTVPTFLGIDFLALLAEVLPDRHQLLTRSELAGCNEPLVVTLSASGVDDVVPLAAALSEREPAPPPQSAAAEPDAPVLLQFTSGTTSQPKAALLSNVFALNYGVETLLRLGVEPGEAVLNTQPFYHVGGSCGALPAPLLTGCRMVVPDHYKPEDALRLIETERCVSRGGFATMYLRELALPGFGDHDLSSLRAGWAVGSAEMLDRIRSGFGIDVVQLYGATEGGLTSGALTDPARTRRESVGRPFRGTEVRIVSPEEGSPAPTGDTGEIVFRGWARLIDYLGSDSGGIDSEGWFHSGDLGHLDADGYLYFDGRLKEMIKPGGENVAPAEVERVLLQHPDVVDAAVFGVPDPDLIEVVCASVQLRPGTTVSEEELRRFCRRRLANFRVPRGIQVVEAWPLTESGKIVKRLVREQFIRAELGHGTSSGTGTATSEGSGS
ncbi:MAG: hypothetical protein ABS81_06030 [Pseudonocardia sp. SCN 72-86]|nr:MAG: hypothetical protein ABS81_06030 [Pseudonocardia sp. SCN 72-86]